MAERRFVVQRHRATRDHDDLRLELDDPDLRPDRWGVREVAERLRTAGDPFRPALGLAQELPALT